MNDTTWTRAFAAAVSDVGDGMTWSEAADRLRNVIRTGLLKLTDITKNPERFFEAHRLLAVHAPRLGPGFWIRFTVHYNLFAGTVVALGTPEQIEALERRNASRTILGCFGLTECLAGVHSGLIVDTTAEYVDQEDCFVIRTPRDSASKNWISQGLVADEGIVVASTVVGGKNYGPQAFLVQFRDEKGQLASGITATDMGKKTVGNDLDNAKLQFTDVRVPRSALLARYLEVSPGGRVTLPAGNKKTMDAIGQRLFTGRVAVAQAGLSFAQALFAKTYSFASTKECWAPKGRRPVLADVPQIRAIFAEGKRQLSQLSSFMQKVEAQLCECLRKNQIPPVRLQQAIAVGKVKGIETAIGLCFALKQEVGSYALMAGTGFEQLDFLQCCKFAEGDSRILMQKMSRDIVRSGATNSEEATALSALKAALAQSLQTHKDKAKAWDDCYLHVYALAEAHMGVILKSYGCVPPASLGALPSRL